MEDSMSIVGGIIKYIDLPFPARIENAKPPKGRRVEYRGGSPFADTMIQTGDILTVDEIYVHQSSSYVQLKETGKALFSTHIFYDVEEGLGL